MTERLDSAEKFLLHIKRTSCTDYDGDAVAALERIAETVIRSAGSSQQEVFYQGMRHGVSLMAQILQQTAEQDMQRARDLAKAKDN